MDSLALIPYWVLDSPLGKIIVLHLVVDTRDAMGANAVNTMAEKLAPHIEEWTGSCVYLRILSNLADKRIVRARAKATKEALGGEDIVDGIVWADTFASVDPYRAATHNKGIMTGVIAVVNATGNDTRAIEGGAHCYAARTRPHPDRRLDISPKSKPALCPFSNDSLPMQVSMSSACYIIILLTIQPHPSRLQIPTGPVGKRPRPRGAAAKAVCAAGISGQLLMRIVLSLKPVAEIAKRGTLHQRLRAGQSNPRVKTFDQREIP